MNQPSTSLPSADAATAENYARRGEIARGGMGSIIEAEDRKLHRTVALKVMLPESDAGGEERERFVREATVLARLAHPNIVPIYDIGRDDAGRWFYTMKLVKGRTLQNILTALHDGEADALHDWPLTHLLTVFRKMCDALAFAHVQGIIHRDLKPENVMVGEFGEVLVMDWGLAKVLERSADTPVRFGEDGGQGQNSPHSGEYAYTAPRRLVRQNEGFGEACLEENETAAWLEGGPESNLAPSRSLPHSGECAYTASRRLVRQNEGVGGVRQEPPLSLDADLNETLPSNASDTLRKNALRKLAAGSNPGITLDGDIMGTPQYMSPEQAQGRIAEMDSRSDIFSLGGILYAILTLRPPVEGKTLDEVLQKVTSGTFTPLTGTTDARSRPVPHALAAVFAKACSVDQARRYQTVAALSADIDAYQNGFATSAEQAGAWKRFTLLVKRHKVASLGVAAVLLVGATLGTKAFIEGQRAEKTLGELRGTAPTFEAQSRALLGEGKHSDALVKIGYAVKIAPENADYRLARAHLLQSAQQLTDAADEYRRVIALRPGDAAAQTNLDLCTSLLAEKGGAKSLTLPLQGRLLDALIAQRRDLEAAPLAKHLNRDKDTAEATIRARLASYTTQKEWNANRIRRENGVFTVDLGKMQLGDLNALRGLPIVNLHLWEAALSDLRPLEGLPLESLTLNLTRVTDLSPLRGMKLRKLHIHGTAVTDLTPLTGMPLKELHAGYCRSLSDLTPLAGMPLEVLILWATKITDIHALRGLPLRELDLHDCSQLADFSPLAGSATLEKIILPRHITDISFLATLPKLKLVAVATGSAPTVWVPAHEFIAMYGAEVPEIKAARTALAAAGIKNLPFNRVAVDPDHLLRLDPQNTPLADLTPLSGLPIKDLNLTGTQVNDLTPLRGMPLTHLGLAYSKVSKLEPLRGMSLVLLHCENTPVRDVSPLADIPTLEDVIIPDNSTNIERLRTLPKLRHLSTRWNKATKLPEQTAEEFWKEFDARKAAGK